MKGNHNTYNNHNKNYPSNAMGFTLIELMISLVLGLLISAAVMQVYLINARTLTVQQSASEVQDSTIFAMQALDDHIRIANLGNPITSITDTAANGGIVLAKSNVADIKTGYMTVSTSQTVDSADNSWTGASNTNITSDQLTIQYRNITPNDLYDCEGAKVDKGSTNWVIERYFVRLATDASNSATVKDLVLACDAGRLDSDGKATGFGDNGQVVVSAIDQFKVLLGTQTAVDNLTYLPAKTYLELTDKPAITTVKLGVIVRSSTPLITDADKDSFIVLGIEQTLKADTTRKKYYRRSYESTILLRNARLMSVTTTKPIP